MYVILFSILLLAYPLSALACDSYPQKVTHVDSCDGTIAREVSDAIQKEVDSKVEIRTETPNGAITAMFIGRLYLEGFFYRRKEDKRLIICDVSFAIKVGEDGKLLFIWHRDGKES